MNLSFTLALRYLAGRKLRTLLTTLAVVFGVLLIFGMNIILPTLMQALQVNVQGASGLIDFSITHISGDAFFEQNANPLYSLKSLRAVSPLLKRTINLPANFIDNDPSHLDVINAINLIGVLPEQARALRSYPVVSGRYLQADDSAAALISQTLADALAVQIGDSITIPSAQGLTSLKVIGILPARTELGNEEVWVTLNQAQAITGQTGLINLIEVAVADSFAGEASRAKTQAEIEASLGSDFKIGSLFSGAELFTSLLWAQVMLSIFGMLALFMGAFIIFNTFRTVIVERRHDIGMLRALGATRFTILGIILAEGLIQGIIGTFFGLMLGYGLAVLILQVAQVPLSAFINIKLGSPVVSMEMLLVASLLGVGVTVLSGLIPAISASRITPLEALRPSSAEDEFKRQTGWGFWAGLVLILLAVGVLFSNQIVLILPGGFLFLLGLVLITPALVQPFALVFGKTVQLIFARQGVGALAQGNLTRQPARTAVTASATMFGLAVVVAAGGLVSSLVGQLYGLVEDSLGSDYLLVPPSVALWNSNLGVNIDLADGLRAVPGVAQVSTLRFASTKANGQAVSILGIDPPAFSQVSGLLFQENLLVNEQEVYQRLSTENVLIANKILLVGLGVKNGDVIALASPNGTVEYRIVAVAADLLNAKLATAYISQANLARDFGSTQDVFLQLDLKPDADRAAADKAIRALAYQYPQFQLISGQAYYEAMRQQMDSAFSAMFFLFGMLVFPSFIAMLNTLAIGVLERTREIGMLRAVGATRRQISNLITAEALILAAIGSAFGVFAGLYLGYVLVLAVQIIFPFGYSFPVNGILLAIGFGLFFGVLAAILPARQAAQMDVVQALRYE